MLRPAPTLFFLTGLLAFSSRADEFDLTIRPLLDEFCLKCHSTTEQKGEFDLETHASVARIKQHPKPWQMVLQQLADGEMPPKKKPQLSLEQKDKLMAWVRASLDAVALERAGDPEPVVLRRLSNAEYTYTIRDLTGVESLHPAREFLVDGAAGEGFTNTGQSLVISPSLITKYLDAGKVFAGHAALLPDGIRFSKGTTRRDWTEEMLAEIRAFYAEFTVAGGSGTVTQQGLALDRGAAGVIPLERYLAASLELRDAAKNIETVAAARHLNAKYLGALLRVLSVGETSQPLAAVRARWNAALPGEVAGVAAEIAQWQKALWKFGAVGHIGKRGGPKAWMEPVAPSPEPAGAAAFRAIFPAALCYTKIVPVDEVVTLTLFHREDEPLQRLLLDDVQRAKLDRLWDEPHFLAQDALTLVDAFEQIWQFSTQDGPNAPQGDKALEPIQRRAEAFKKLLVETEPRHVETVLEFAARAYRRALTDDEKGELRSLYRKLRAQDLPHEVAIRLTLARVLVSPAFLYKSHEGSSRSRIRLSAATRKTPWPEHGSTTMRSLSAMESNGSRSTTCRAMRRGVLWMPLSRRRVSSTSVFS